MNKDLLKKYAELTVRTGINIQKNQILHINATIDCIEFVRFIAESAYDAGAENVIVDYVDEELSLMKYKKAPKESFSKMPTYAAIGRTALAKEEGAAFLSISSRNPELLKDIDPKLVAEANKANSTAFKEFYECVMGDNNQWCVVAVPTESWAKKVFPNLDTDEAVEKLWEQIFKIVRVDKEAPVEAWNKHLSNLQEKRTFLNKKRFKYLYYKSEGTDLTIELPTRHQWLGGADKSTKEITFVANMPTEEVFTLPLKTGVNGYVKSTKPLIYGGNVIDNFVLTFKDGKVVDIKAEKGYEILKNLIETDEGSHYLGEVALVPYSSPISESNIIFFNTLFDENASCHLALGSAYSSCIEGFTSLSEEEKKTQEVNNSLNHVDFMIGSKELNIIGETVDGEKIQIFKDGNWAF